jgi:hypothetical protein
MKFKHHLTDRNCYTYELYREHIDTLHAQDKTTGNDHSEAMLAYSKMNVTRMKRLDNTIVLRQDLIRLIQSLPSQKWLILTEAWCGDAAQNIPWINTMASLNEGIQVQLILRDENLDIMNDYLTNGGKSIPKLIALNENEEVLFTWGPRPMLMQEKYAKMKHDGIEYAELSKAIHSLYAKDKGNALQEEFYSILK